MVGFSKKIKDKIQKKLGNETIGILGDEYKEVEISSEPEELANPIEDSSVDAYLSEKEVNIFDSPILSLLHIPGKPVFPELMTPEDINNLEFSLIAPLGADPNEVENFCDRVQSDLLKYIEIIHSRQRDFEALLGEVVRLSQTIESQKYESQLANMLDEEKRSKEVALEHEVATLRLENKELRLEVEELRSAGKRVAIRPTSSQQLPSMDEVKSALPKLPSIENEDSFDEESLFEEMMNTSKESTKSKSHKLPDPSDFSDNLLSELED